MLEETDKWIVVKANKKLFLSDNIWHVCTRVLFTVLTGRSKVFILWLVLCSEATDLQHYSKEKGSSLCEIN